MNSKVQKSEDHILKNKKYQSYISKCDKLGFTKNKQCKKPFYLYSFHVYLAFTNAWTINWQKAVNRWSNKCYETTWIL